MAHFLTTAEVAPLLDMAKGIEVTESAFAEQGRGLVVTHAPYAIPMAPHQAAEIAGPLLEKRLRVVSGGLLGSKKIGIRCGPREASGENASIAVIYGASGALLAVMGYPFGTLRTGATIGVAVKYMARQEAKRVGLIGTGRNALSLLEAVSCVRPVIDIRVYSRNEKRLRDFCAKASKDLDLAVEPVEEPRNVFDGADIVLTATSSREPVFAPEWMEEGAHVSSMGPISELDQGVFLRADSVVVGSREQEQNHYYDPRPPFPLDDLVRAGSLTWEAMTELGDVVSGKTLGRRRPEDVTVFHESQGGFGDIALAGAAYEEALRLGLGQEISF